MDKPGKRNFSSLEISTAFLCQLFKLRKKYARVCMAGIQNMQLMQINFASTSVVSNLLCVEPFDPPMQNTINTLTVCVHALQ